MSAIADTDPPSNEAQARAITPLYKKDEETARQAWAVLRSKHYCRTCPVRRACLEDAMGEDAIECIGVFGGTTTLERRRARRLIGVGRMQGDAWLARSPEQFRMVVDRLEDTLDDRYAGWVRRAEDLQREREARRQADVTPTPRPPAATACIACGVLLGWRKRSDARTCSVRCRVATHRQRASAPKATVAA